MSDSRNKGVRDESGHMTVWLRTERQELETNSDEESVEEKENKTGAALRGAETTACWYTGGAKELDASRGDAKDGSSVTRSLFDSGLGQWRKQK